MFKSEIEEGILWQDEQTITKIGLEKCTFTATIATNNFEKHLLLVN